MNFLAIDPGTAGAGCAWAYFAAGGAAYTPASHAPAELVAAGFARTAKEIQARPGLPIAPEYPGLYCDRVVVERPQIDGRCPRPGDLVDLAWNGAALAYSIGVPVLAVTPRQWKGSVPKPIHLSRALAALSPAEWGVLPAEARAKLAAAVDRCAKAPGKPGTSYFGVWTGHNLLDAVALGLYYKGLLGKGMNQ